MHYAIGERIEFNLLGRWRSARVTNTTARRVVLTDDAGIQRFIKDPSKLRKVAVPGDRPGRKGEGNWRDRQL